MFETPKGGCGERTSNMSNKLRDRTVKKKKLTLGITCCLTICSEFPLFPILRWYFILFNPIFTVFYFFFWSLTRHWLVWFTCWRAHKAWNVLVSWYEDIFWKQVHGRIQGRVFFYHTFQMCSFDQCKETVVCDDMKKIKDQGGFFIFQQTASLKDTLVQFTIISRATQTTASISFAS